MRLCGESIKLEDDFHQPVVLKAHRDVRLKAGSLQARSALGSLGVPLAYGRGGEAEVFCGSQSRPSSWVFLRGATVLVAALEYRLSVPVRRSSVEWW